MEPVGRHLMSTDHVTDLGSLCLKKDRRSESGRGSSWGWSKGALILGVWKERMHPNCLWNKKEGEWELREERAGCWEENMQLSRLRSSGWQWLTDNKSGHWLWVHRSRRWLGKALYRYGWGRASLFIHVHWLPPLKAAFERSALDLRKMKLLYLRGRGLPDERIGGWIGGVWEAGHKHNMLVGTTSRNKDMISRK